MLRFSALAFGSLVLASGSAFCADVTEANIDDMSVKKFPEPIKCYIYLGAITGDKEIPVGLAIQLCARTKNAEATLVCYKMAFEALKLNRGQAIELCGEGRRS